MKRVKSNGAFQFDLTPDVAMDKFKQRLEQLYETNLENYDRLLVKGTGYGFKMVKPGETVDIPNHQYEAFKNVMVDVPVSSNKYNKFGQPIPFVLEDAKKLGVIGQDSTLIKMKLIELVEDLDEKKQTKK